jgi:putative aldouronate transport system permease protein
MKKLLSQVQQQKYLLLMMLPGILVIFIFSYIPMYGILIAFKDYKVNLGITGSPWVGLQYFEIFFKNPMALRVLRNTLILGVYSLLWGFPVPIIFALLLNEVKCSYYKKLVQSVSYFPTFISTVIIVGMLTTFAARDGLFNKITGLFGMEAVSFLGSKQYFRTFFVASGIWQGMGYSSILYLAALAGMDPTLYDVAEIDGANRWQKIVHINWEQIKPTTTILLIFAISGILGTDFQKVLLMYNPTTYEVADVIGTYVYREGILGAKYEYTTAIGLFMSIISFMLLFAANLVSRKLSETSLF